MTRRRRVRAAAVTAALCAVLGTAGCTGGGDTPPAPAAAPTAGTSPAAPPAPIPTGVAPTRTFAVGVRQADYARGSRPLPTTVWYPATGAPGGDIRRDAAPAPGPFPLVLFSHGLRGRPSGYRSLASRWASAGFVVAAPTYPYTNAAAPSFNPVDVINQPADASAVLDQLLADPPAPVDPHRIAAAGHSAGGYTTTGLLSTARDARIRAAVVIAGALLGGGYTGTPVPVLFIHGDADEVVGYSAGRQAYDRLSWPKGFLTLPGADHGKYLVPDSRGFTPVARTTTDFLRWTLYGDRTAHTHLAPDATVPGVSRLEDHF